MIRTPPIKLLYLGIGFFTCMLVFLVEPNLKKYFYFEPRAILHLRMNDSEEQADIVTENGIETSTWNPMDIESDVETTTQKEMTLMNDSEKTSGYLAEKDKRKNVIFIIVDDLRPQLGAYFNPDNPNYFSSNKMHTPNLDKLASRSLLFKNAYNQMPLCGPSRASMLTSRRPDMTRAFTNNRYWRETGGNFTTLPQHFKNNGYLTLGLGKVFHTGASSANDDPISWSQPYYRPPFSDMMYLPGVTGASWAATPADMRAKFPLTDDSIVQETKSTLRKLADDAISGEQPFFMGVGFRKPHLSFVCPEEFFKYYPLEEGDQYMAQKSWQTPSVRKTCGLNHTVDIDGKTIIPDESLRKLRRAYFSCISYTDYNVGLILEEVDRLGLSDSTIVSFVADHGYHAGENDHWGKMTPFEMSTHIPMMIHIPGETDKGVVTATMVEAVDLYPTLVEAAGLDPITPCPEECSDIQLCTHGISLLPLVKDPETKLKEAAFSQVTALLDTVYTVRTSRFRYIEKAKGYRHNAENGKYRCQLDWGVAASFEMFDHDADPDELHNIVNDPRFRDERAKLRDMLHNYGNSLNKELKRIC